MMLTYLSKNIVIDNSLFCEYDILKELVYLSKESKCRDINLEIINSIAMLVLNLKNNESLYYLFSNNYINQIISNEYDRYDDDFISYYVNFLKSLSLKLDITTIQFFFHKQINSFPLIESAIKIYNHPDPMIKNVVRNIFLTITKLRYEPFFDYLCSLPSVTYFAFIICYLRDLTINLEKIDNLDKFKLMQEDIIDEIMYIQDIFSLKILKINYILTNALMFYYVMPLLLGALLSTTPMEISISLALYMLIVLFYYIQDENFINSLFYVIFSPKLSKGVIKFIKEYPIDPKNYFFSYQLQKNQTSDSYSTYIENHFSAAFIRSIVHMNNSPYVKIREIAKKYEDLQDINPNYNPNSPNYLETITKQVLERINASEFSIISAYHKRLTVATGVNCGMNTKDWNYCFMSKMNAMFEKISLNQTNKLVSNKIKSTLYSFFKTKGDNLLLLVNLLLFIVLRHNVLSKELLNNMRLFHSTENKNSMMKTYSQKDINIKNDHPQIINKTKTCVSFNSLAKEKKYDKIKVSLSEFVKHTEEQEKQMFTNDYICSIFTIQHYDYDCELVDSLLKVRNVIKLYS